MSTIELSVPDISCGHCEAAITKSVGTVVGVERVEVDIAGRSVCVTGDAERAAVIAAVEDAGYDVC
jgi:copper chaperone CopZ